MSVLRIIATSLFQNARAVSPMLLVIVIATSGIIILKFIANVLGFFFIKIHEILLGRQWKAKGNNSFLKKISLWRHNLASQDTRPSLIYYTPSV